MGRFSLRVRSRHVAHGLMGFLAVVAAILSSTSLMVARSVPLGGQDATVSVLASTPATGPTVLLRNPQFPPPAPQATSARPEPRAQPVTYKVSPGDAVSSIAQQFGITPQTVVQANSLKNENRLSVGEELVILPVSGVLHTVKAGDTLGTIARTYKVAEADIQGYAANGLTNANSLQVDQKLIVPGGTPPPPPRPAPPPAAAPPSAPPAAPPKPASPLQVPRRGSGQFAWPTTGPITQYSSAYHPGIDIAPPYGTPIYAADAGRITRIEQLSWGYGWSLYIDHGNGFVTHYSHLSSFAVEVGAYVERGQLIARVGSTGRSSGPHLDFEIRYNGVPLNPLGYLP